MWTYNYTDDLYHHGVKGMRWGVRRYQRQDGSLTSAGRKRYSISEAVSKSKTKEKDYRKKLSSIEKRNTSSSGYQLSTDAKLIEYRNQKLSSRVAKTAAGVIASKLITDTVTGNIGRYKHMSTSQIAKELTKAVASTAANVALNDALAKSVSRKYTDEGAYTKKKRSFITKEDVMRKSVGVAIKMAPVIGALANMKMAEANAQRARNEELFKSWGQNILTEKTHNVIWQSDDGYMSIIDDRGR